MWATGALGDISVFKSHSFPSGLPPLPWCAIDDLKAVIRLAVATMKTFDVLLPTPPCVSSPFLIYFNRGEAKVCQGNMTALLGEAGLFNPSYEGNSSVVQSGFGPHYIGIAPYIGIPHYSDRLSGGPLLESLGGWVKKSRSTLSSTADTILQ